LQTEQFEFHINWRILQNKKIDLRQILKSV
jgi:hypothetical protein